MATRPSTPEHLVDRTPRPIDGTEKFTADDMRLAFLAGFEAGWQMPDCNDPDRRGTYAERWLVAFVRRGREHLGFHDWSGARRW